MAQPTLHLHVHYHCSTLNLLGSDLIINDDVTPSTITYSTLLPVLDEELKLQTLNDNDAGEMEYFVLAVTNLHVFNVETGQIHQAFSGAPLKVIIIDDDCKC